MARSFLDWAVGPLRPGRVGAVFGFLAGIPLSFVLIWLVPVPFPANLLALPIACVAGAFLGAWIGRRLARQS